MKENFRAEGINPSLPAVIITFYIDSNCDIYISTKKKSQIETQQDGVCLFHLV